ncbi:MAG: glycosyltransferase family 1 protein [Nitrospirae bacterium]|nr:MAG: glycosyltransferase family 1 protein [Nitrospirota bacterium]
MRTTVCHIITKLELGGAQKTTLFTVQQLDRTRFTPILITGEPGLLDEQARALEDVEFHQVPCLVRAIRLWKDVQALLALTRLLKKLKPVIVHTHSSKAGILGRWAAWLARVPIIIHTVHGFGITSEQPWWLRRLLIGAEWLTGLITTHWLAVSLADIDSGIRWGLFRGGNITLIRPGIDIASFHRLFPSSDRDRLREELGVEPGHLLVGTVSCLKPQKAPHDFVDVAAHVCACMPAARFVLVGDGELRAGVEAHIRSSKLEGRVTIVGWRRDIPALMRAFDVFLLTSHWEGLPQVLLEARASGLPVVATKTGGASETVNDGYNGWLCAVGDVKGLAARVLGILLDVDERTRFSRNAGDIPSEFLNLTALRKREALYDTLLERSGRGVWDGTHGGHALGFDGRTE